MWKENLRGGGGLIGKMKRKYVPTKEEIYIGVFAEIKEGKWRSTVLKE